MAPGIALRVVLVEKVKRPVAVDEPVRVVHPVLPGRVVKLRSVIFLEGSAWRRGIRRGSVLGACAVASGQKEAEQASGKRKKKRTTEREGHETRGIAKSEEFTSCPKEEHRIVG